MVLERPEWLNELGHWI